MGYRGFYTFSARKVVCILLLMAIGLLVLHFLGRPAVQRQSVIRTNVYYEGKDMGGLTKAEAAAVISYMSRKNNLEPVDAVLDPETNSVIPDISGAAVDVGKTIDALLQAGAGTVVEPVYREIPAGVTLSSYPGYPVYRGNPAKPQVAFLINVAWGNEYLQEMQDILQEEKAGATFFLVGRWVRENQALAQQIAANGFEIANHGDSDAISMAAATQEQAAADIRHASVTIEEICGIRPLYFSPHRGELTEHVLRAAESENVRIVMWTVDTLDWMLPGVDVMVEKILSRAGGGSLILMHPTEQTAEFLRRVIPGLRKKGYEPVSLSRLFDPADL